MYRTTEEYLSDADWVREMIRQRNATAASDLSDFESPVPIDRSPELESDDESDESEHFHMSPAPVADVPTAARMADIMREIQGARRRTATAELELQEAEQELEEAEQGLEEAEQATFDVRSALMDEMASGPQRRSTLSLLFAQRGSVIE